MDRCTVLDSIQRVLDPVLGTYTVGIGLESQYGDHDTSLLSSLLFSRVSFCTGMYSTVS